MLEVNFYDTVDDDLLKFAVIISQSNGKWVMCKHKERDTYEVPGGHRVEEQLQTLDALIEKRKGSLCEWLEKNKPDWQETIGRDNL